MPASFFAPASVMLFPSRNSLPIWGLWVPKVTRGPLKRWHALTAWHHSLTQPNHGSALVEISVARDLPYDLHQINTRLTPESASLTLQHPTDPLRLWRIRVERRGGCQATARPPRGELAVALPRGHFQPEGGRCSSPQQGAQHVHMLVAQHAVPQVNVARRPFAGSTDEVEAIARKAPNRCDRRAPRRDAATKHCACCRESHCIASALGEIGEPPSRLTCAATLTLAATRYPNLRRHPITRTATTANPASDRHRCHTPHGRGHLVALPQHTRRSPMLARIPACCFCLPHVVRW